MKTKPLASISLDLDNQWSYMKTHGDAGWESFPSYLDVFIPHVLDILTTLDLKITFFIVGQDAALDKNHEALAMLTKHGHEVGNHSFHHEQWMFNASRDAIKQELMEASEAIVRATGQRPRGFRGPGFTWNRDLLEILVDQGYLYDASTLPTYLGPVARWYYFRKSSMGKGEMQKRKYLFGSFSEGLRPVKPYLWKLGGEHESPRTLLEMPVTTIPLIKTPFHLSYLLYLRRYSSVLMSLYLKTALGLCRLTGTEPSFLLHPLDLLGPEQVPQLKFFPGMDLSADHKISVFSRVLSELGKHFTLVNMSEHAEHILRRNLPVRAARDNRSVSEAAP